MWPGDMDDGGAMGDWTIRLVGRAVIEAVAASTGKPYIARIVGRDPTYAWQRVWLKPKWEFPARNANPAAIVRLVLPVSAIGSLPAALEIRWGPADGAAYVDKTGQSGRLCGYRGFFIMSIDGLKQVQAQHVAMLLDDGLVGSGPPQRPPGTRPMIRFDEEV